MALNGELAGFFEGKKGLRQGDSISPYLFIMIMEVLSRVLNKARLRTDSVFTRSVILLVSPIFSLQMTYWFFLKARELL